MIIGMMSCNMIIFLSSLLGTIMFNSHLKSISKSIDVYLNPKAYKPKNQVKFISLLIDHYQGYTDRSLLDIDSLIKNYFYDYKIGKFTPLRIESLAKRGKQLLWASIFAMTLFEAIDNGLGQNYLNSIMIIMSIMLGIILVVFQIYSDIDLKKEKVLLKIKSHLINEYPYFKASQKEKQKMSLLLNKIDRLESEIKKQENAQDYQGQEKQIPGDIYRGLQEEDIADILRNFDLSQI